MDTGISRRDFVTKAALAGLALVAAPIALGSAQPKEALADDLACNCEVYIKGSDLPWGAQQLIGSGKNAYLTNSKVPTSIFGPFPNTPNGTQNATYVDNGSTITVTVPVVNTGCKLININSSTIATIESVSNDSTDSKNRIDSITVTMPKWSDGSYTDCVFTAEEYIDVTLAFLPISDTQNFDVHIRAAASSSTSGLS